MGQFNELIVTNGGLVLNTFGFIGANSGGLSNRVVVTGGGSVWKCSQVVNIGNIASYCQLIITNGGQVETLSGIVGNDFSSTGNLLQLTGSGSRWTSGSALHCGPSASGNLLVISDGADVVSSGAYVGGNMAQNGSGRSNSVVIIGPGSTWTNTGTSSVGNSGAYNRLTITNGGVLKNSAAFAALVLGWQPSGSNNTVLITGAGSLFANPGTSAGVSVGQSSSFNEFQIRNGAVADCDTSSLGSNVSASNNLAVVADSGSVWVNQIVLNVGQSGSGNQLLVTNNGMVRAGSLLIGSQPASSNNLVVINGGTLTVTNSGNSALLDIRRGRLTLAGGTMDCNTLLLTNVDSAIKLQGGLARLRNTTCTVASGITVGDNGPQTTLELVGNGTHTVSGGVVITNQGVLAGQGSIVGSVTNLSGGTISPGNAPGSQKHVVISGAVSLNAGSTNLFEIGSNSMSNDRLTVGGTIIYGGTLIVSNLAGTRTNGDRFVLFAAPSYSGAFDTLTLPVLVAGLAWTNKLSLDGSLEVIAVVEREVGVDVSHFQNESGVSQSSWNQMYAEGKRFAFIKATEGLTGPDDAAMFNNVTRATAAGVKAGVYHFAHPENRPTTTGAVQEADHFLAYAGNFIGPGYLRPVLDVEFNAAILGTTELTDWVIAFSDRIIALRGSNAAPIIYCNQTFANDELDSRLASYDLWLRTISGVDPATSEPPGQGYVDPTGVFNNWSFWQYSDSGTAGGITPLDLNVCHSDFKLLSSFVIPATLTPVPPIILGQPQNQMSTVGGGANFAVSISITSSPPLFYQWRLYGTNLAGATQSGLTLSNVQGTNAGAYTVVVTNAAGAITSAVANLTIFQPYVLYQEDFDGYVSPSVVTTNTTTNGFKIFWNAASGPLDFTARFGFDYSALTVPTNIPPAPRSVGTTKGLSLTVNKDATAAAAAINLYPISQSLTGSFAFKFDLWINWTNTSAATEHALFGINHSGNITNRIQLPTSDGLFFAVNGDGGSTSTSGTARDYSVFRGGGTGVTPLLTTTGFGPAPLLGAQFDNLNPGFTALSPSRPVVNFSTPAGSAGLGWMRVEVRQETNLITWLLNDTIVAQYTNTTAFTNGNVMIGYNDVFNSIGEPGNFAIFDNLRVETIGPDYDMDGLLDAWEIQFFGGLASGAGDDSDGDGASNSHEYLAGTNPTNAASTFKMLGAARINDDITLRWTTVGGRGYRVQLATNATAMFGDISPLISVGGVGDGATNYLHFGGATNQGGFYRIRIEP